MKATERPLQCIYTSDLNVCNANDDCLVGEMLCSFDKSLACNRTASLGGGESPIVAYIVRCNRVAGDLNTKGSSARDQATMGSVFLTCWPLLHSTCANAQLWSKLNLDWLLIDLSPSPLINVGSENDCEVCFPNYSPQDESTLTSGARGKKQNQNQLS